MKTTTIEQPGTHTCDEVALAAEVDRQWDEIRALKMELLLWRRAAGHVKERCTCLTYPIVVGSRMQQAAPHWIDTTNPPYADRDEWVLFT